MKSSLFVTAFNPRPKHLELLKLMKIADPTMIIKSSHDDTTWEKFVEFPMRDEYKKHFNMTESKPPRGARKVTAHFQLQTKSRINTIKFSSEVYNFLKANSIYLVIDHYEMQKIASIGYITEIHPTLTWLPTLEADLTTAMQQTQLPKSDIDEWKAHTQITFDKENDDIQVPPFHLSKKAFAFGNGKMRIETQLLQVNCAVADAKFLKTLMSDTFLNGYMPTGTFLPAGLHLITDTATLKQKLSDHNQYLNATENIAVVGLPPNAFGIPAEYHLQRIIDESNLFQSVETTSSSDKLGKHFFITNKAKSDEAKMWIDNELTKWTREFIPDDMQIPNFDQPRRTVLSSMSPSVSNYASALQQESAYAEDGDYNRTAPAIHRKKRRQEVTMVYDDKDYPALPNQSQQNKTAKTAQKNNQKQASQQQPAQQDNTEAATKTAKALATAEAQWKAELKATGESYGRRITNLNRAMDEKLEIQQKSIQAQLDKSIATTELLSKQVNNIQASVDSLTQTLNAFIFRMSETTTPPGATPQQQEQQSQQQMAPQRDETGAYVTPPGQFAMTSFSTPPMAGAQTQQSSLHQAAQMQHLTAGYNTKFMSPMYAPPDTQQHQGQMYPQQLVGPHTTNNMDMSPKRVGN